MRRQLFIVIAATGLANAPAHADDLQQRLVADARATQTEGYAFTSTTTMETTGVARKVVVERYDPRAAPAARWMLVSIDGRPPTPKQIAGAAKRARGPHPGYARLAEWLGAPATRSEPEPGYVLYKYPRLPAGTVKFGSHDASADTRAEALVNTKGRVPFVERLRFVATKGFRVMLVASVSAMTVDSRYRLLPNGTVVPEGNDSAITGSLMGKSGQLRTKTEYAGFAKVR